MSLLGEVSSLQPSMQIHLGTLRARSLIDGKALSSSFIFGSGKRLVSSWKSLNLPLKLHGDFESFKIRRGRIFTSAVATFETESSVQKQYGNRGSPVQIESTNKFSEEIDERERLRRMRISQANKGATPWNKGRKHSAETLQRIKERTRMAMQSPKVKMKLTNCVRQAMSDEVKVKIAAAMKRRWDRRRKEPKLQDPCHFEWQNLIAEAARTGFAGEDELQWDSYEMLMQQIEEEWSESVKVKEGKVSRRRPRSLEVRRKVSALIAAKWANPEYRERVTSAIARNAQSRRCNEEEHELKVEDVMKQSGISEVNTMFEKNTSNEVLDKTAKEHFK